MEAGSGKLMLLPDQSLGAFSVGTAVCAVGRVSSGSQPKVDA